MSIEDERVVTRSTSPLKFSVDLGPRSAAPLPSGPLRDRTRRARAIQTDPAWQADYRPPARRWNARSATLASPPRRAAHPRPRPSQGHRRLRPPRTAINVARLAALDLNRGPGQTWIAATAEPPGVRPPVRPTQRAKMPRRASPDVMRARGRPDRQPDGRHSAPPQRPEQHVPSPIPRSTPAESRWQSPSSAAVMRVLLSWWWGSGRRPRRCG